MLCGIADIAKTQQNTIDRLSHLQLHPKSRTKYNLAKLHVRREITTCQLTSVIINNISIIQIKSKRLQGFSLRSNSTENLKNPIRQVGSDDVTRHDQLDDCTYCNAHTLNNVVCHEKDWDKRQSLP